MAVERSILFRYNRRGCSHDASLDAWQKMRAQVELESNEMFWNVRSVAAVHRCAKWIKYVHWLYGVMNSPGKLPATRLEDSVLYKSENPYMKFCLSHEKKICNLSREPEAL